MAATKAPLVFYDVETTIPSAAFKEYDIIEFGAIVVDPESLLEIGQFSTLVSSIHLTKKSIEANGITVEMLNGAPPFSAVADGIFKTLDGAVWIGHNIVSFDNRRIAEEFERLKRPPPKPSMVIDTLPLWKGIYGKRAGNLKLDTLSQRFGIGKEPHRAVADSRICFQVFLRVAAINVIERFYGDVPPVPAPPALTPPAPAPVTAPQPTPSTVESVTEKVATLTIAEEQKPPSTEAPAAAVAIPATKTPST